MTDLTGTPRGHLASFSCESQVAGPVSVPSSKSIAQRVVVAALLARGTTRIEGLPPSEDVLYAIRSARAAGAAFPSEGRPDDLLETALVGRSGFGHLTGLPPGDAREGARPWCTLPVGESGTAARLFTAAVALARPPGSGAEIIPSGSLIARTSPALFQALDAAGVGIEPSASDQPGSWPVLLTSATAPEVIELIHPSSSQEVSALLMALAAYPEQRCLRVIGQIPSRGYVEITAGVLAKFGAFVGSEPIVSDDPSHAGEVFTIQGPMSAPSLPFRVEPDASAAAVALAAGALSGGSLVEVLGLGLTSQQPDVAVASALAAFGCDTSGSSTERLCSEGEPRHGATVDCTATPDLAPVLAAVGAYVAWNGRGRTELTGLGTLPGKESSRIEVLAVAFRQLGLVVKHDDCSLSIESLDAQPEARPEGPFHLDAAGDHRMAFAFGLLSLAIEGVWVTGANSVAKSWPQFWYALVQAGAVQRPVSPTSL